MGTRSCSAFRVYESFQSREVARTGEVPMPGPDEEALGGHAVLAVGYDDATGRFLVRNSWGPGLGKRRVLHPSRTPTSPTAACPRTSGQSSR